MAQTKKLISIVVPVFNENSNIHALLTRIYLSFLKSKYSFEVIFIDDYSTDNTYKYLLSKSYPNTRIIKNTGKKGKAFSLVQGFAAAKGDAIVMLDADLQYPPEEICAMVDKLEFSDIVVANRKGYKAPLSRKIKSKGFRFLFGSLFKIRADIQSGLKAFRKDVINSINLSPKSGWTFDLQFLHHASHAGFRITSHDITFEKRFSGKSSVDFRQIFEIGFNAISLRLRRVMPQHFTESSSTMLNAGVGFKKTRYITHTTLPSKHSAIRTFEMRQKLFIGSILALIGLGLFLSAFATISILIAVLSAIYFIDVVFNLALVLKSLYIPQEITFKAEKLRAIDDTTLPKYTILCPLYKEAHIIPQFLKSMDKIDWPKDKLEVILLLEEDDKESIKVTKSMNLPFFVKVAVVPHSYPKTKPKACNYGLSIATGEYLVIYDAEDIPDPLQLKKAYTAFINLPRNILCLQAKLNYFNPTQNLLTRFFTAEYSLWFDITLLGLQSLKTAIPLGGTSNHFRTVDLLNLEGWDPFNVTEDADLGMRLFKKGYKTAIIDSTTLEEANSKVTNWIRQRSRWIKGYMQTYLVHNRDSFSYLLDKKHHSLYFHLTVGGKIAFILINPVLWLATISYFTLYAIVGPTIESLFPPLVFYMAGFSLVVGNFLFLYYYMIGCIKRGHYDLIKYVYLIPIYWILISIAGTMALHQLIFKPHYWEKTTHGLTKMPTKKIAKKKKESFSWSFRPANIRYLINS